MKTLIAILILTATVMFASDTTVAGKWQITMDTPHGTMAGPFTIEQNGSALTAKIELDHVGTLNMTGKLDGSKIFLELQNHGEMSLKLSGTLDGNKLTGTMSPQGGAWSATRQ